MASVTLAVLAGGEGSRMGRPKGELMVNGLPILAHLLQGFAWPGPRLLVTAPGREKPPGWELFDREVADPVAGQGPLRGIMTALENVESEILLVATVDMPAIEHEHLAWIAGQLLEHPAATAVLLRRGTDDVEPFPCGLRREAIPHVRSHLAAGRRSVHGMLRESSVLLLSAPADWGSRMWSNLNYPADAAAFGAAQASSVLQPDLLERMMQSPDCPPAGRWAYDAQKRCHDTYEKDQCNACRRQAR